MSPVAVLDRPPRTWPLDTHRGTWAMYLFIATEAALFVCLFFSYAYLGRRADAWPPEIPRIRLAIAMTVLLVSSSVVLRRGEVAARRGAIASARRTVYATVLLGAIFLAVQALEFHRHLQTLRPQDGAYGSIFYTITSVHALHVMLGIGMLAWAGAVPEPEHAKQPPHRALHNAALYWHFVDAVWLVIVAVLYVLPRIG